MAIKTWVSGETITASDLNNFAGNAGLVYVANGTLSLTTTASNVTGVFDNTRFRNYRVLLYVTARSVSNRVDMRYISGTTAEVTNYFQGGIGSDHASNATIYYQRSSNDAQFFGQSTSNELSVTMDIFAPNRLSNTLHQGNAMDRITGYSYHIGGMNRTSNAFTGFQLFTSTGTATVEYQVFGYREA